LWAKSAGIGLGRTTAPRRACTGAAEPTERPSFQRTCAAFVRTATSLLDSAICDAGYPGACHSTLVLSTCGKCYPDCTPQAVAQRIRAAGEKVSRPSKSACTDRRGLAPVSLSNIHSDRRCSCRQSHPDKQYLTALGSSPPCARPPRAKPDRPPRRQQEKLLKKTLATNSIARRSSGREDHSWQRPELRSDVTRPSRVASSASRTASVERRTVSTQASPTPPSAPPGPDLPFCSHIATYALARHTLSAS